MAVENNREAGSRALSWAPAAKPADPRAIFSLGQAGGTAHQAKCVKPSRPSSVRGEAVSIDNFMRRSNSRNNQSLPSTCVASASCIVLSGDETAAHNEEEISSRSRKPPPENGS